MAAVHKLMKDDVRDCLEYAMQVRRRVKEQLKKIGGMEFYDVHFSYIDKETLEEHFVSVKEQGGGGLIPEGQGKPGVVHTIGLSDKGMPGVYRIEMQVTAGSGKLAMSGSGIPLQPKSKSKWRSITSKPTPAASAEPARCWSMISTCMWLTCKIAVSCEISRSPAWSRSLQAW